MPFQPGKSGNPRGRPKKGDSLAELIRVRWSKAKRRKAIDVLAAKAEAGDVQAFEALAKRGWPDEAKGELTLVNDPQRPLQVVFGGRFKPAA